MKKERKVYVSLIDQMYNGISSKLKNNWGFNPWPLIRIQTGYFFFLVFTGRITEPKLNTEATVRAGANTLKTYLKFLIQKFKVAISVLNYKLNLTNTILLVGFNKHRVLKDNILVSNYLNPFKTYLDDLGINNRIFLLDDNASADPLNVLFNQLKALYKLQFEVDGGNKTHLDAALHNSSLVKDFLNTTDEKKYASQISGIVFKTITEQVVNYNALLHFLKITRPKAVWTYCYYDNNILALVRAANDLGIETLEYQHGTQSDDHFAYAPWQGVDLYAEFLPKMFWTWRLSDQQRAKHNFAGKLYKPKAILGGNPFLAQQIKLVKQDDDTPENKPGVLITLQGSWIPSFIEEYIKQDEHFKWYFRLHPRYPDDKIKLEKLHNDFTDKIDIKESNTLSLYELFKKVQYHITVSSSTALEAQAFGVINIIFSSDGYSTYKDYIDSGAFEYVTDFNTLNVSLNKSLDSVVEYDPIIIDSNYILNTVRTTAGL